MICVTATHRGTTYYRTNDGGWTPHREGAKDFRTVARAEAEKMHHWQYEVTHNIRVDQALHRS